MFRTAISLLLLSSALAALSCATSTPPPPVEQTFDAGQIDTSSAEAVTSDRIDEYLERLEILGFTGSVLVARDGEVLLHEGYGYADRERQIPYTTETVSTIGSITKQFTAAAIMTLAQEGLISVDDPVTKFFDDVPADKRSITVHHLLTHSSGLPGAIGDDLERIARDPYIAEAFQTPLRFAPGSEYGYSNVGYSLLAAIIEKVTGQPYEVALRERILLPAGLEDTGYQRAGVDPQRLAHGVMNGEEWGTIAGKMWGPDGPGWHLVGNGGIVSTPADLYRWHQALLSDEIFTDETRRKIFTPWIPEGEDSDSYYGYGWAIWLDDESAARLIAHNGGNGIFAADMLYYPREKLVVIGMSSVSDRSFIDISSRVAQIARGEDVALPPKVVSVSPEDLRQATGHWTIEDGGRVEIVADGDHLLLRPADIAALAALSAPVPDRARPILKDVSTRTRIILDASMAGNFLPLQEAFGGPPLEEVEQMSLRNRERLETENGPILNHEVVHSYIDGGAAAVLARLEHERGESYLLYRWGNGGLRGIRVLESFPETILYPTAPGQFASWDFRRATSTALALEGDRLLLTSEGKIVRAER